MCFHWLVTSDGHYRRMDVKWPRAGVSYVLLSSKMLHRVLAFCCVALSIGDIEIVLPVRFSLNTVLGRIVVSRLRN